MFSLTVYYSWCLHLFLHNLIFVTDFVQFVEILYSLCKFCTVCGDFIKFAIKQKSGEIVKMLTTRIPSSDMEKMLSKAE